MKEKRNISLRDALLKSLAIAAFTAVPATAIVPTASAAVLYDDVNDNTCDLGGGGRGDGTQSDPFAISTVQDLAEIGDCEYDIDDDVYYVLTNDIDATPDGNFTAGDDAYDWNTPDNGWQPIGDYHEVDFTGVIDGKGFTVSNLEVWGNEDNIGLFATSNFAVIKNLNVEIEIDGNEYDSIGGLVGYDYSSTIVNVHADVDIYDAEDNTGGLIGYIEGTRISKSSTEGSIVGDTDDYSDNIGGIVGYANNDSNGNYTKLTKVSSSADINDLASEATGDIEYENVGGIVGYGNELYVNDAVFSGTAMGNDNLGGIVGYLDDGAINDAVVTDTATLGTAEDYYAQAIGGVLGESSWDVAITNVQFNGTLDLDKSSTTEDTDYTGGIVGYLDGSTLSSATVGASASIAIRGNGAGSEQFGGIVGYAYSSTISNVVNNADVRSHDVWAVGGIVGEADITAIDKAVNRGEVHSTLDDISFGSGSVGGVVGYLDYRSSVSNSTNKGDVILDGSEDPYYVGGIVGEQDWSVVTDTYNTGDVYGTYDVAGITGYVQDEQAVIQNSYNLGKLTAWDDNIDGIANLDGSYLDGSTNAIIIDSTDQTNAVEAAWLTVAEIKDGSELVDLGWALNTEDGEWATDVEFNEGYPYLVWETVSSDIAPEVGLLDQEWSDIVTFNGGKRFRLYTSEKNALNTAASIIKENPFASVDLDIYYGKKIRLAGKRALAVKRWLVHQGVDVPISVHIYQADNTHAVGSVHLTAYAD